MLSRRTVLPSHTATMLLSGLQLTRFTAGMAMLATSCSEVVSNSASWSSQDSSTRPLTPPGKTRRQEATGSVTRLVTYE